MSILNVSDVIVSFTKKDKFTSFISPGFNNPISAQPFFIKTSLLPWAKFFKVITFLSAGPSPTFLQIGADRYPHLSGVIRLALFFEEFFKESRI